MTTPKKPEPNTSVPQDDANESEVAGRSRAEPNTSVPQDDPGASTSVPQDDN